MRRLIKVVAFRHSSPMPCIPIINVGQVNARKHKRERVGIGGHVRAELGLEGGPRRLDEAPAKKGECET